MHQLSPALIVDAVHETRNRTTKLLATAFPSIVVDVAADAKTGRYLIDRCGYRLVLVDVDLAGDAGYELIARAREREASNCVIAISSQPDAGSVRRALKAGAEGYLLKADDAEDLIFRMRGLGLGSPALSPAVARELLTSYLQAPPYLLSASRARP